MFKIIIPSIDELLADETKNNLKNNGFDSYFFDGYGYDSFSKLINNCILSNEEKITIICNDKSRPKRKHIQYMLSKINDGFGFVGLYRFGFFAIHKDLINKIGLFDERYLGGGYEDEDFIIRMIEANVACICVEEIDYISKPSRWKYDSTSDSRDFFNKKWTFNENKTITRNIKEEDNYNKQKYDFKFLEWEKSILTNFYSNKYLKSKVE